MWPLFPIYKSRVDILPTLIAASYTHYRLDPLDAQATFAMFADGRVTSTGSASPPEAASYPWLTSGEGADYEVNATLSSGSTPSGSAVGSWLALSTNRSWSIARTTPGMSTCTLSVAIRPAGGGSTITTKTITLTAEVDA